MRQDTRPSVALLQRAAKRHRDLCYVLTDRSDVDEYAVAVTRSTAGDRHLVIGDRVPKVDLVNEGATVWPIVVDNRAVEGCWANAVPATAGAPDLIQESGLRPNRVHWRVLRISQYGTPVIDATVRLRWTFGARHAQRGAYIPGLWIDVPRCEVQWGVRLQLTAQVLQSRNVGPEHDPVAGVPIAVSGSITTPLGTESLDWRLAIRGDGSTTRWWSGGR